MWPGTFNHSVGQNRRALPLRFANPILKVLWPLKRVRFVNRTEPLFVAGSVVRRACVALASPTFASWNQIGAWLNRLDALRRAA